MAFLCGDFLICLIAELRGPKATKAELHTHRTDTFFFVVAKVSEGMIRGNVCTYDDEVAQHGAATK